MCFSSRPFAHYCKGMGLNGFSPTTLDLDQNKTCKGHRRVCYGLHPSGSSVNDTLANIMRVPPLIANPYLESLR